MPSFDNKKQIRIVITLGTGKFGSSNNNQIILQGFRTVVDIDKAGGMTMSTLKARVYGVRQQDMNSVTTLQWKPGTLMPNTVEVYAIDGLAETLVFAGNIVNAWADYQSMPEVFLHIQARAGFFNQLRPVPPRSFKGGVDVPSVMAQIARDLGYTFENNGVTTQLVDVYLPNTGLEQAKDLARAAGCDLYLDDKILAITPPNVPRKLGATAPPVDNSAEIARLKAAAEAKTNEAVELLKLSGAAKQAGNITAAIDYNNRAGVALGQSDALLVQADGLTSAQLTSTRGIVPRIAADSGLIGYPTFDGVGVNFRTLFNPSVVFGGSILLVTDVQQAAGEWVVTSVAHHLESEKPGGAWFSTIRGNANGLAVTSR